MSPQLDAALTTLVWCAVLYFIMLATDVAIALYVRIYGMFSSRAQHAADQEIARDYVRAIDRLAETQKKDDPENG